MTITPKSLFGESTVSTAAAAVYTVPANTTVVISRMVATNVAAAGAQLTLWIVRSGGARADTNILVGASAAGQVLSAGASEPYVVNGAAGLVLNAGDAIHAKSDTASAINLVASGWSQ
jgi:hypothetical protein